MIRKGVDCAAPLTAEKAKALAAAGVQFVGRYLVPERSGWKRLTRAEAEAITAAGMTIISVYETSANRAANGASAGQTDGAEAYREAKAIGQPAGTAIYFAVDFDAQPKDYDAIEAYLRAAARQIPGYEVGVYGSYAVIEEMARRGAAKHFWQTYAWSRGQKSAHANIYQYKNGQTIADHSVDLNESYGNEGWWDTNPKKEEKPVQTPIPDWKRKDHDELRAAGFLTEDHTAELDAPVPQWMLYALVNRLRKSGAVAPPSPQPKPTPAPQPPATEPPKPALSWPDVERLADAATIETPVGAGVLLKGGFVLTAHHVTDDSPAIPITTKDGKSYTMKKVCDHPKAHDSENVDLALYRIDTADALPSLSLAPKAPDVGERLLAVGHPGHTPWKHSYGERTERNPATFAPWLFEASIDGEPGNSGGPVVNQRGELAGVMVSEITVNVRTPDGWHMAPGSRFVNLNDPVVREWLDSFLK